MPIDRTNLESIGYYLVAGQNPLRCKYCRQSELTETSRGAFLTRQIIFSVDRTRASRRGRSSEISTGSRGAPASTAASHGLLRSRADVGERIAILCHLQLLERLGEARPKGSTRSPRPLRSFSIRPRHARWRRRAAAHALVHGRQPDPRPTTRPRLRRVVFRPLSRAMEHGAPR